MNDQEKEIQKYKEQGRGKKKKGQIAAEPEKYKIDETKMIGTPDMLTESEKKKFVISAMARQFGTVGILAVIIGPLGSLLSLGAVEMIYSHYMLGKSFNEMIDSFYRPFIYTCAIVFFGVVIISWLTYHFVFANKKGLIIRADDKIVEAGMEPVEIPRTDKDKNRLIEAFYHIKVPYKVSYILVAIALAALVFESVIVIQAGAKQKVITDNARKEAAARIEKSLEGFEHKGTSKVMAFVDHRVYKIGNIDMTIEIDENGQVLDASYMLKYNAKYSVSELDKLKSEGVRNQFEDVHNTTKEYKDLFVYPTVTEVPVKFSNYMTNYIDNIREKSEWEGKQECKIGDDKYIMHCKVSYSEGKTKKTDDDSMKVSYEIQKKNFKRTQW